MLNLLCKKIKNESKLCIKRVRKDLDKLLDVGFIYFIKTTQWLSPLVIVSKKNGKLRICVDYWKLNAQTKKDPFPLPFLDSILDLVAGHEMYSFMDGYNGYNQVKMVEKDKKKKKKKKKNIYFRMGCICI
jgi:hypothetical protein